MVKKLHQAKIPFGLRTATVAVASCLALSGVPLAANAAGLGKIVVLSALGQPLRAEIEVSATREELADMKAQLASPDAFKQAGLDYATSLLGIRFGLDKRANGKSVIRLSSEQPINDPFVDMLLEINWPTGRLVREYTFLLDPPEMPIKAAAPVAPAQAKAASVGKPTASSAKTGASGSIDDEVRSKAVAKVGESKGAESKGAGKEPAAKSTAPAGESSDTHQVMQGETLRKIASDTKPEGVSLEQMLVGLLRANQSAFDGGNMNRLKSGKILSIPDKATVESVSPAEAKKIVVTQSSDWTAYRNKLAGIAEKAPAADEAAKQETAGKITAKVEDKAAPAAEPKDQLKVSKTDASGAKKGEKGAGSAGSAKPTEEDLIARDKAVEEANKKVAFLQEQVTKLEKLIELKNQNLADLEKQAAAKAAAAPVQAETPAKPVEETKPAAPATTAPAAEAPTEPAAAEKPAEPVAGGAGETPAEAVAKPEEAKHEEAKPEQPPAAPVEKPKAATPPPPVEEPGFFDGLLDSPLTLGGIGAAIVAAAGGIFMMRRRRAADVEKPLNLGSTLTPPASLTGNSVFRSTGGQSVDTSHTPAQTDFSQAGPGSIDTDEVDPVAEADVYMAYGRDAQAEEILLEAKQKDPKRYAIHLKLLEIYANRKDVKQFETLATDLYSETGGAGADWEKAAAMGQRLDSGNPLYGSGGQAAPAFDADATVIVTPQALSATKSTVTLPGELSQLAQEVAPIVAPSLPVEPAAAVGVSVPEAAAELASLDFDLGLGDDKAASAGTVKLPEPLIDSHPIDFNFAADSATTSAAAGETSPVGLDLHSMETTNPSGITPQGSATEIDFDLGVQPVEAAVPSAAADDGVEFDVSLTESTFLGRSAQEPSPSNFDMSSIDLDLNAPEIAVSATPSAPAPMEEVAAEVSDFEEAQVSTAVNPDFSRDQSETMITPAFAAEPEYNMLPEQDFSIAQAETQLSSGMDFEGLPGAESSFPAQSATMVNPQFATDEADLVPEFEVSNNEEVATKLDLAKAYEEMGDFEGAGELLQEVLNEGDAAQKEKARAILAKISS